jgi:predicted ribosomally synthesized peptide with SipW-like signal peptide
MNKKLIISLSIIGVVAAVAIGGTVAYFSDVETSTGNTLSAGTLDLQIDFQCPGTGCDWSLRDLTVHPFFNECDVKPGDSGEATISWHVYNNNAWGRIKLADVYEYENGCSDEEGKTDTSCGEVGLGEGELDDNLKFTFWMDEGTYQGWQCPDGNNGPCPADPQEGDNILNGIETVLAVKTANELLQGVNLPYELEGSTTYYLGMKWEVPGATGDIIQGDSLMGKIIMEIVQSRNNPNPWTP